MPAERLGGVDPGWVALLSRRVEGETASEMRRHGETRRLGLYALYLMDRRRTMIDGLVDLVLEIVHRLQTRSRRKVIGAIARDIERVHGKERLLVDIAAAAVRVLTRFVQKYTLTLCCGTGTSRLGTEAVSGCPLEPSRRPVGVQHRDKNGSPRIGATRNGIRMESVPLQVGTGCQWRKSPYLLDGHRDAQSPTHRAG